LECRLNIGKSSTLSIITKRPSRKSQNSSTCRRIRSRHGCSTLEKRCSGSSLMEKNELVDHDGDRTVFLPHFPTSDHEACMSLMSESKSPFPRTDRDGDSTGEAHACSM